MNHSRVGVCVCVFFLGQGEGGGKGGCCDTIVRN